jgi:hypothetical protein
MQGTLAGGSNNGSAYWNFAGPVSFPATGNFGAYQNSGTGSNGGPFGPDVNLTSGSATSIYPWLSTGLVVFTTTTSTTAAATVYIDGALAGTCGGSSVSATNTTCSFTFASGSHTAKIVGPATGDFQFNAGEFVNGTSGISIDNLSHTGAEALAFTYDVPHQLAALDYAHANGGISAGVIEVGANEYLDAVSLATLKTGMTALLTKFNSYTPKPSVVIWDFNYFMGAGQSDTTNGAGLTQADYHAAIKQFATDNGLPVISMNDFWGKTGGMGFTFTDLAHPNDDGNNVEGQQAEKIFDPNGPAIAINGELPAFVLDGNPHVAVAYSVRRLYMGATKAIQVTSSAAGNPTADIGFTASGDLNTTALASFCGANTCTVSKWYDQSPNGHDAIQATLANQPVIYTAGAIVAAASKAGVPTLQFGATGGMVSTFSTTGTQVEANVVGTYLVGANAYGSLASVMDASDTCNVSSGACLFVRNNDNNQSELVAVGNAGGNGALPYTPGNLFWQDSSVNGSTGTSVLDQLAAVSVGGFSPNLAGTHLNLGSTNTELSEYVQYVGLNEANSQLYLHNSEKTYFGLP